MRLSCPLKSIIIKYGLLLIIWGVLTAINVNKAYHIDDSFHLKAAQELREHPLKPMSGLVNWENSPTPLYMHNQPPLFFYLIAATGAVFGESEIVMHLLLSIFTFLALYYFSKLTKILKVKHSKLLLIVFGFSPALIINQNLMVDVPLLAMILGVSYFTLKAKHSRSYKDYIIAAVFLSLGLLIKYTILPLFVAFILAILINRDYKKLTVLLIPLGILSLWSLWNIYEFGAIHLLNRSASTIHINKLYAFMGTLGAVSTFTIYFFYSSFPKNGSIWIIFCVIILFILSAILVYLDVIGEVRYAEYLDLSFKTAGFLSLLLFGKFLRELLLSEKQAFFRSDLFLILLFLAALALFIILFSPFIASRHILLVIPFILLFGSKLFEKAPKVVNLTTAIVTIVLGLLLGISDWVYADFYRKAAKEIKASEDYTTWSSGHWGWQWYAEKNGMKTYSSEDVGYIKIGDIIAYPKDIHRQEINEDLMLKTIEIKTKESNILTFFSGKSFASMYNINTARPAWTLSKTPIDTIIISRIEK
jgi:hypothetical protein